MNTNKFIKVIPKVKAAPGKQTKLLGAGIPKGAVVISFDPYMDPKLMSPEMTTCAIRHFMNLNELKKKPHVIRFVKPESRV